MVADVTDTTLRRVLKAARVIDGMTYPSIARAVNELAHRPVFVGNAGSNSLRRFELELNAGMSEHRRYWLERWAETRPSLDTDPAPAPSGAVEAAAS